MSKLLLLKDRWTVQVTLEYRPTPRFVAGTVGLLAAPGGQGSLLAAASFVPGRSDFPDAGSRLESFQSWVVNNEMTLERPTDGKRLRFNSYLQESSSPERAVLNYHFTGLDREVRERPQDWRVVYRTPESVVVLPMTFTLKNIPLP